MVQKRIAPIRRKSRSSPRLPQGKYSSQHIPAAVKNGNGKDRAASILVYHEELLQQNEALRETQAELEHSRDRFARLYHEAPVGYMTLDRNGVIEEANLTAANLLGGSLQALARRPLLVFVHTEDRRAFLNFMVGCRSHSTNQKQWCELRLRKNDGRFVPVQLSSVGVSRASGAGVVYLTALTDISGRIEREDERREARNRVAQASQERAAAEAANEAKDRFLAMLSHELRTPLTPALIRVSALVDNSAIEPAHLDELKLVKDDIEMEARLIDDLLDLSRILRGKLEPRFEPVDIRESIRRALHVCASEIEAREIVVAADMPARPVMVSADPVRMQQVFWNLLRNAVKFNSQGGRISISVKVEGGEVQVRVEDSGIGIEPQVLPRIFSPFEQGDKSVTRQFGGLGLGLAISRGIIEAHRGRIDAQSDGAGKGAAFCVMLPVATGALAAPQINGELAASRTPSENGRPIRVLLVEDHKSTRTAMTRLLASLGYEMEAAASARQAMEAAARREFDLVISDLGLPDMTGYELMERLRERGLKGIALSGFGMEQDRTRSLEAGFRLHLTKPVTIQTLQRAITSVL